MAGRRRQNDTSSPATSLKQPDRSGLHPSRETLLGIAEKRGLLVEVDGSSCHGDNIEANGLQDPPVGRVGEAVLWSISLAMLHFTFDVLAQNQYAIEISWSQIATKSLQAFVVILFLIYILHPHSTPSPFLPRLLPRVSRILHQAVFFLCSVSTGCYLIYITNEYSHYAVLKQAPPLGCLWIWSVIELDLRGGVGSLVCCGVFMWLGNYSYL